MTSTHSARRNNARLLCIETLENRELLSVTAAEFAQIRADNADLNLSANMANYNVIEITAANLSDTAIHNAIAKAGTTTESDLIVLRTTATRNKITLGGSELEIDIDASKWGSVTLVGFGTNPLTLDANQGSRIYNITDGA
ncbi:MAG: hypothetical protein LBN39_00285, partial [Planctomycetaceae bacterium]|nr:hypothetical protein [Planctomycetaceae bacterium]